MGWSRSQVEKAEEPIKLQQLLWGSLLHRQSKSVTEKDHLKVNHRQRWWLLKSFALFLLFFGGGAHLQDISLSLISWVYHIQHKTSIIFAEILTQQHKSVCSEDFYCFRRVQTSGQRWKEQTEQMCNSSCISIQLHKMEASELLYELKTSKCVPVPRESNSK